MADGAAVHWAPCQQAVGRLQGAAQPLRQQDGGVTAAGQVGGVRAAHAAADVQDLQLDDLAVEVCGMRGGRWQEGHLSARHRTRASKAGALHSAHVLHDCPAAPALHGCAACTCPA